MMHITRTKNGRKWSFQFPLVLIIWTIVWVANSSPYLLSNWNPWNISLIVCAIITAVLR